MSPGEIESNKDPQALFSMATLPGQLEMLQRALQQSRADNQDKEKKIREFATTISHLESSLKQESTRVHELETEKDEKTTEIKDLRALLKTKDQEYRLLQQTHHAAEEQSTNDEQEIHILRQTNKKQRNVLDTTKKEIKELGEGNAQLQEESARLQQLQQQSAEKAYQRGFNEAHALIKEASTIQNPGPRGASVATSWFSSMASSARMSIGSGQEHNTYYAPSGTSQSQSQSQSVPGLTLEQELAGLIDESNQHMNRYESSSPWSGSDPDQDRTDTYEDDLRDEDLSILEPYQADLRDDTAPPPPRGKSELATETVGKSDESQSHPCAHNPDLSESEVRRDDPGVRMVLLSTLACWWWWWWQWQRQRASAVIGGVSILVTLSMYMWWTDGAWQQQQVNQSPWSVSHERCLALGSDIRWVVA